MILLATFAAPVRRPLSYGWNFPESAQDILNWEVALLNTFSVASIRALSSIRDFVDREIHKWEKQGVRVNVSESSQSKTLTLHCQPSGQDYNSSSRNLQRIKSSIANGLSDIIIDEYEKFLVTKLIDVNYAYLSERDRALLKAKALKLLSNGRSNGYSVRRSQRKSRVWAKLSEYLEMEDQIMVEGFITFRLKDYLEDLFDFVDQMVKEHLINREYREFLRLLRHFMSRQPRPLPVINIHRDSEGRYRLLNGKMKPLSGDRGGLLSNNGDMFGPDGDDLVVSAVVTLAPHRIVWHGTVDNSSCFDLLSDLFSDNLRVCDGCSLDCTDS